MPAHGIPHNSNTKCLPSPPPASLRLELPKRKAQEQPCIHVPVASAGLAPSQGSPTAVFEAHHPLPSSWGGPGPARRCPRAHRNALACGLAPCNTGMGRDPDTQRWQEARELAHLCSGASPLQLHQRTTRKFGRSGFSLGVLWKGRHNGFGVKSQVCGSVEIHNNIPKYFIF